MSPVPGSSDPSVLLRSLAAALIAAAAAIACNASPVTADLGDGLRYIRLQDASVNTPFEGNLVVDLRFTDALEESADALGTRIRAAAQSGARLFVLVNPATDPLLRRALAEVQGSVRPLLFIGPVTPELAPEIVTDPDPETERRACDAIAAGTAPAELVRETLDKPRFDEAELARHRTNGGTQPLADGTEAEQEAAGVDAGKPVPIKDVSLQRAVFMHRALIALGRDNPTA